MEQHITVRIKRRPIGRLAGGCQFEIIGCLFQILLHDISAAWAARLVLNDKLRAYIIEACQITGCDDIASGHPPQSEEKIRARSFVTVTGPKILPDLAVQIDLSDFGRCSVSLFWAAPRPQMGTDDLVYDQRKQRIIGSFGLFQYP